jgi:SAM-dependent methyltransferase
MALSTPTSAESPCPYCGTTATVPLWRDVVDRLGCAPGPWEFRECVGCHSALLRPTPREADLLSYYPPAYSFATGLDTGSRLKRCVSALEYGLFYQPMYRADARSVVRNTRGSATGRGRVLDVGCGRGMRLLAFRRLGYEVFGTDFQPEVVEWLRTQCGIPAVCADANNLDQLFEKESFDIVTAYHVIEHLLDASGLLRRCYALLKPGGWLAVAAPLCDSVQAACFKSRWQGATEAPRHVSIPSREGLRQAFRTVGFSEISIVPDSLLNCAGILTLSLLPHSTTPVAYRQRRAGAMFVRLLAGLTTLLAIPCCLIENYLFRRPACGVVFARKPLTEHALPPERPFERERPDANSESSR